MLSIMQRYGWTYQEYMQQPAWLLDLIPRVMEREAKQQEDAMKH